MGVSRMYFVSDVSLRQDPAVLPVVDLLGRMIVMSSAQLTRVLTMIYPQALAY